MRINQFNKKIIMLNNIDYLSLVASDFYAKNDNEGVLEVLSELVTARGDMELALRKSVNELAILLDEDDLDAQFLYNTILEINYDGLIKISDDSIKSAFDYASDFNDEDIKIVLDEIMNIEGEKSIQNIIEKYGKDVMDYIIINCGYESEYKDMYIESDKNFLLYKDKKLHRIQIDALVKNNDNQKLIYKNPSKFDKKSVHK